MSLKEILSAGIAAASVAASTDILAEDAVIVSNPAQVAAETVIDPVVETQAVTPEVVADKPTKERKAKKVKAAVAAKPAKAAAKPKKKGRGRPVVFFGKVKKEIVRLIRKHGITGSMNILAAKKGELADLRNKEIVPKPLSITPPTLVKFGQEAGITLKRGRRAA